MLKTPQLQRLLVVELLQKRMRIWQEAYVEVKLLKAPRQWGSFGSWTVEKPAQLWHKAYFEIKI